MNGRERDTREHLMHEQLYPVGMCQCGCGRPTKIAKSTNATQVKGQPTRFLKGHYGRGKGIPWRTRFIERDAGYVTPCSEWTGSRHTRGYGTVRIEGKVRKVHILVWEDAHGPVPEGYEVCHHCDNPPCGRDDHLFLGTHGDNMADAARKGRLWSPKGETHYAVKLTPEQVQEIRATEGVSQAELGRRYGVTSGTISAILSRKTWAWL